MSSNHTQLGAWVNSKMSARNPPLYCTITVVVVFFALTDRASTIPSNTVCMYGHTYKSMDQPGSKVANPVRGQLNREK